MGNYYHLLVETPLGNLSRAIRHLNGVYTQRYNRSINTDGSLFRGPAGLTTQQTLAMIGVRNPIKRYRVFGEAGLDNTTEVFYRKKTQAPILGTEWFIERISQELQLCPERTEIPQKAMAIDIESVIQVVIRVFNVTEAELFNVPRGRGKDNPARNAALYIARKTAVKPLSEIAEAFGLAHYGSVSGMISRVAWRLQQDKKLLAKVGNAEKTIKVQT